MNHPPHDPAEQAERPILMLPVVTLLVLLAAIFGVSVVADDDDGDAGIGPVELLAAAPDAVRAEGSARMTIDLSMSIGEDGMAMGLGADGVVDFVTGAASFELSLLGQTFEVRSDGETMWLRVPGFGAGLGATGDDEWLAMPAGAFAAAGDFPGVSSATGLLEVLRGIGGEITEVGTEEVNGVEATRYHVVVNLEDAIANAPEALRDDAASALREFDALGAVELPLDVWITESGLPVRQVMTFTPEGDAGALLGGFGMELTVELSDFGTPVEVEAPPADQVRTVDADEIGDLFGAGGGLTPEDFADAGETD